MKRNYRLSLRSPEATRSTAFNQANIKHFFTKLKEVMDCYKFQTHDLWNCDETRVTTVRKPGTIVTPKGKKQV